MSLLVNCVPSLLFVGAGNAEGFKSISTSARPPALSSTRRLVRRSAKGPFSVGSLFIGFRCCGGRSKAQGTTDVTLGDRFRGLYSYQRGLGAYGG